MTNISQQWAVSQGWYMSLDVTLFRHGRITVGYNDYVLYIIYYTFLMLFVGFFFRTIKKTLADNKKHLKKKTCCKGKKLSFFFLISKLLRPKIKSCVTIART